MNKNTNNSISNRRSSTGVSHKDAVTSTDSRPIPDDEPSATTSSTSREQGSYSSGLPVRNFFNAFTTYILSSEDDPGTQNTPKKDYYYYGSDRDPMFVIVDSSCVSNPSSKELLIDNRYTTRDPIVRKLYNKNVKPVDMPSTSRDLRNDLLPSQLKESESNDEMQMIDINLQSENELSIVDSDTDNNSIVISYLKNKDAFLNIEELSEHSIDALVPSYPGSPRSFTDMSIASLSSTEDLNTQQYKRAIEFLHHDNEFLIAAELGDEKLLRTLIKQGTNIHVMDHLGRNALHFAVCTGNRYIVALLLNAGVKPNVKDNVGMTPLSLCLMRRPSWRMATLLFDHGAVLVPRSTLMDTGLFLQFVMMSAPTKEEERILRLLVEKGALVNDPGTPGGRQALHFAAMSNNTRLINILMDLGADLYFLNHRNETPKQVAESFRCKEAYLLLEKYEELYENEGNSSSGASQMKSNSSSD